MSLILHYHPLASFCWKVLIALYEKDLPFEGRTVDLGDPSARAAFLEISPFGKMPVLQDEGRGRILCETSIIIEYLDRRFEGPGLLPADADLALEVRFWDRVFDLYVEAPMQQAVAQVLGGAGRAAALAFASEALAPAYDLIEARFSGGRHAAGEDFSVADCAAFPGLFYARTFAPFGERARLSAYFERLLARPSVQRTLAQAQPYLPMYPLNDRLEARFLGGA